MSLNSLNFYFFSITEHSCKNCGPSLSINIPERSMIFSKTMHPLLPTNPCSRSMNMTLNCYPHPCYTPDFAPSDLQLFSFHLQDIVKGPHSPQWRHHHFPCAWVVWEPIQIKNVSLWIGSTESPLEEVHHWKSMKCHATTTTPLQVSFTTYETTLVH